MAPISLAIQISKAALSHRQNTAKSPGPNYNQNIVNNLLGQTRLSRQFSKTTLSSECSQSPTQNLNQDFDIKIIGQTRLSPQFFKTTLSLECSQSPRQNHNPNYDVNAIGQIESTILQGKFIIKIQPLSQTKIIIMQSGSEAKPD